MKKEELREDRIKEVIIESVNYLQENIVKISSGIVVIILIIGLIASRNNSIKEKNLQSEFESGRTINRYIDQYSDSSTALNDFKTVFEENPNSTGSIHAYIYILSELRKSNNIEEYRKFLFDYNIESDDNTLNAAIHFLKGDFYFDNEEFENANNEYRKINDSKYSEYDQVQSKIKQIKCYFNMNEAQKARGLIGAIDLSDVKNIYQKNEIEELKGFLDY